MNKNLKSSAEKKGKTVDQIITATTGIKKLLEVLKQTQLSKDNLLSLSWKMGS